MRSFWFVCVIAALALVLSACGGEEKPARTPDEAELREMVMMTSEGLPWAISLVRDQAVSNEAAASEYPEPEQWLSNYEEWGRVSGYEAEFRSKDEVIPPVGLGVELEYYSSAGGAESAWAASREFILSEEMLQVLKDMGAAEAAVREVDAEEVGDESVALLMTTDAEGVKGETFAVLFRRGGVVASAAVSAAAGDVRVDDAVAVAEQLDARIQDVLNR
ncbi:MAG: hypothetical protein MUP86_01530 [Dehalococcoidia bacterium]|nr:hypothetical protein [Dehalococcoidia bacterium]